MLEGGTRRNSSTHPPTLFVWSTLPVVRSVTCIKARFARAVSVGGSFTPTKLSLPPPSATGGGAGGGRLLFFAEPLDRLAALQNCRDELATMERKYPISDGGIVGMIKLEIE